MGLFTKSAEQREREDVDKRRKASDKRRKAKQQEEQERRAEFLKSPAGQAQHQAKIARETGARVFQISLSLSETTGRTVAMTGAYANTTNAKHGSIIDLIEAEGWRLEHAGYVYRQTGSVSRDKFFSSGQQEAIHGEIMGVYIFRATQRGEKVEIKAPGSDRMPVC